MSLIAAENLFGLLMVFTGLAAFGFWSEHTRLGKFLSGVILVILAGIVLSNLRIVPFDAAFYGVVWSYVVPLAIPLLLMRANLRELLPVAGPMLLTFVIAAFGTLLGAIAGFYLIDLGPGAHNIAATIAASWIGGSMNFAATSQALGMEDGTLLSAMAAADNVGGTIFLVLLVLIPGMALMRRFIPSPLMDETAAEESAEAEAARSGKRPPVEVSKLALHLAVSAVCCFLGFETAEIIGGIGQAAEIGWLANFGSYGVLFVTIYALIIANLFHRQIEKTSGDFELGMFFMYVFFGVMGAGANVALMIETALPIFGFVGVMAVVHLAVVLSAAKLFKIDLAEAMLVSNAVALGPATAAAQAAAQRWHTLVTPAVMLGVLGYAVANFIGVALSGFLQ